MFLHFNRYYNFRNLSFVISTKRYQSNEIIIYRNNQIIFDQNNEITFYINEIIINQHDINEIMFNRNNRIVTSNINVIYENFKFYNF